MRVSQTRSVAPEAVQPLPPVQRRTQTAGSLPTTDGQSSIMDLARSQTVRPALGWINQQMELLAGPGRRAKHLSSQSLP